MYHLLFAGSGLIGCGLAANALSHHQDVTLYDIRDADEVKDNLKDVLNKLVVAGVIEEEESHVLLEKAHITHNLEAVLEGKDAVLECLPERLDIKQEFYKRAQSIEPDILIFSSTSALFPSKLQKDMPHPEHILVGHPFHPSYMIPLIEIVGGEAVSEETIDKAKAIYTLSAVEDGVASVEDIDTAFTYGPGMRAAILGQLLALDLGAKGGYGAMAQKYGDSLKSAMGIDPSLLEDLVEGISLEKAHRPREFGQTNEEIEAFRDKAIAILLHFH
ncbi:3-hydroxyacyl-CoA dehydrogenase family protein [Sharpea azabuensis]|uniref:3-hydroxyacyl-CoA dehydrogenase family protein n=1 Tax=Sharpea azabuensis TaxID=322505 RepID=UPI00156922B4|nr:3-hydroxyacyl-CoA dehydrogenase NAD-binding domain-containing protein [Sharpea azabuensis]